MVSSSAVFSLLEVMEGWRFCSSATRSEIRIAASPARMRELW